MSEMRIAPTTGIVPQEPKVPTAKLVDSNNTEPFTLSSHHDTVATLDLKQPSLSSSTNLAENNNDGGDDDDDVSRPTGQPKKKRKCARREGSCSVASISPHSLCSFCYRL